MKGNHCTATLLPSGIRVRVPFGETLMSASDLEGSGIECLCGGKGICGKCRARVIEGPVGDATKREAEVLSRTELENGHILLCQRVLWGDVTLEVESEKKPKKNRILLKANTHIPYIELFPLVMKIYHELSPPTLHDQTADLDRILEQISGPIKVDISLVGSIPALLKKAQYRITTVVCEDRLIAIEEGNSVSNCFGIAIDIGTTSVAGYLVDLLEGKIIASSSAANSQRIHGADVITRINYTMERKDGLVNMQACVVWTIDGIIQGLLKKTGISAECIYCLTLSGNTVMSHLLLGVSPEGVAGSPFVPAFSGSLTSTVDHLGLKSLLQVTPFILLPNIAGHVGSDIVGVILATKIHELKGNWLVIDIGTNGEIVLASDGRLLVCSTAAGPAFEGGCISRGMRSEDGAIYRVEMEEDVCCSVIGDKVPVGICGSGLVDALSEMVRLGIVRSNGRLNPPSDCPKNLPVPLKNRIRNQGTGFHFVLAEGNRAVAITQKDVSELQLGKAAIRAGIEIMMDELEIAPSDLDGVFLAGAFGSNLRPESMKGIGMLPPVETERIRPIGNAAGMGTVMALLSKEQMELASDLAKNIEHIELSLHGGFSRKFSKAIAF